MATLIRRADALKAINQLEEKCKNAKGSTPGAEWIVKCYNAVLSCKVEKAVFCAQCGKPVKLRDVPEEDGE